MSGPFPGCCLLRKTSPTSPPENDCSHRLCLPVVVSHWHNWHTTPIKGVRRVGVPAVPEGTISVLIYWRLYTQSLPSLAIQYQSEWSAIISPEWLQGRGFRRSRLAPEFTLLFEFWSFADFSQSWEQRSSKVSVTSLLPLCVNNRFTGGARHWRPVFKNEDKSRQDGDRIVLRKGRMHCLPRRARFSASPKTVHKRLFTIAQLDAATAVSKEGPPRCSPRGLYRTEGD